jgi:transcriptional regulator with XRE-family HTH domain
MSSSQLSNYLQTNRNRLALSQDDVAFLLGSKCDDGGKVSRYETFKRIPAFKTALAFEVIYKRTASELFSGFYREVEKEIAERAKILSERKYRQSNHRTKRKLETLNDLALLN